MVFVTMVADTAEVIVGTFSTLPTDAKDGLLSTSVTHCPIMFDPCWRRVEYTKVKGAAAPVVGSRAIVPDDHHLLGTLKVPDRAHVTLSTVLFTPLPIGASDDTHPNTFHHKPAPTRGSSPTNARHSIALHHSCHNELPMLGYFLLSVATHLWNRSQLNNTSIHKLLSG